MTRADPSLSLGQLCTMVGHRWSMLTQAEKEVFRQRAEIVSREIKKEVVSQPESMVLPNSVACNAQHHVLTQWYMLLTHYHMMTQYLTLIRCRMLIWYHVLIWCH